MAPAALRLPAPHKERNGCPHRHLYRRLPTRHKIWRGLTQNLTDAGFQLPVEELRCFFINIFNVLVLHAKVTSKAPSDEDHLVPRCSFFRNTSYQVGKYFYSLDDICRGILRAKKCLFLDCDPRVHFALSYGTRNTPPARVFGAQNLDAELEMATRSFCTDRVRVEADAAEVGESKPSRMCPQRSRAHVHGPFNHSRARTNSCLL